MKDPCVADMKTAKELLDHGIVGEGAAALARLRRCAADGGCEAWQTCDATLQGAWREAAQEPLPEARARPKDGDEADPSDGDAPARPATDQDAS